MLLSRTLRVHCMITGKALGSSAAVLTDSSWQPVAKCARTAAPFKPFAAAAHQQRRMGWSWPFNAARRKNGGSSGTNLQQLLDVATAFGRHPSAEALQDVKAALGESLLQICDGRRALITRLHTEK